ncbi:MAG TPA: methyltransferase domain-containing protein, partial [Pseudonocardiaceae bacterium]
MLTVDFDRFPVGSGNRLLDVGAGTGRHAFAAYRRGADVVALDTDASALKDVRDMFAAMAAAGEAPPTAHALAVHGDGTSMPFPDGAFDRVIAAEVLEHLPADHAVLAEISRVLAPGGRLAVTVPRWWPEPDLLGDVLGVSRGGRWARADLSPTCAARTRGRGRPGARSVASRARTARAVVVADLRARRAASGMPGVPPVPVLGSDGPTDRHPARGPAAEPGPGQKPGPLRPQTAMLTPAEIAATAEMIASAQRPDGAIPYWPDGPIDPWNLVEAAMGLDTAGRHSPADAAYHWLADRQNEDGSFYARYEGDAVTDPATDTNFTAYVAVGVRHHALCTGDRTLWPMVRSAIDFVVTRQEPEGQCRWRGGPTALLAGNASIHLSLRAAEHLASDAGEPQPDWTDARARLGNAIRRPELFEPKPHAMDWYYPVLAGVLDGWYLNER